MKYWEVIADKLSATGASFALLVFVVASAFAKSTAPEVIFISPCECEGFHGKNRWIVKTDFTPGPLDKSASESLRHCAKCWGRHVAALSPDQMLFIVRKLWQFATQRCDWQGNSWVTRNFSYGPRGWIRR